MLKIRNISLSFEKKQVLKSVTYDFAPRHCYALLGKSGSGKTTLAKAMASILPYDGEMTLDGEPLNPKVHAIGWLPQNHGLIPWKTVKENISLPLMLNHRFEDGAFEEITEELGIESLLSSYPNHISGGERQRVTMARGFLAKPEVLLLDEAFSALDAITVKEAHKVFLKTLEHHKVTTILITHNIEEALLLAETICIFKDGTIVKSLENPFFAKEKKEDLEGFLALEKEIWEAI